MIEEPPLLKIQRPTRRPSTSQIEAFQNVPTSFVVDAMQGGNVLAPNIRPLGESRDLKCVAAGPALTVESGPADILALLASLTLIQPGDIVVNSFHGHQGCASAGDRVCAMARNNGAAGLITDGPARDYPGLVEVGMPLWCTGLNPNTPYGNGPGKVGLPIQIGGQHVETGDMIVADHDGVVVVPFSQIDAVITALQTVISLETELDAKVQEGLKVPPAIEELLESGKVEFLN